MGEKMIYLDNAATSGHKPTEVIRAVDSALKNHSANPGRSGHRPSERAASAIYTVREKVARLFNASGAERVVFTSGCTHSINCVLKGVLHGYDHVITSDLEHNSVVRPLAKLGVRTDNAQVSFYNDALTLEAFRSLIRPDTKMIFTTAASNVSGKRVPIKELGALCRERGILFGVDAAQTAGVYPIDMQRDNIDFLCIAPHKGLYAPMGTGILIAEKELETTLIEGGTGSDSASVIQAPIVPEGLESGTINVSGIIGIGAGIDFINKTGMDKISHHEMKLITLLYDKLSAMPWVILYTPRPTTEEYAPVLSFNVSGLTSNETAQFLDRNGVAVRAGLHCAPSAHKRMDTLENGTVRVSVSAFNSVNDILRLCELIKNVKKL